MNERDEVDEITAAWRRERPDLDAEAIDAMATIGRFAVVYTLGSRVVDGVFERYGLRRGEFDVLAALRRSGAPYTLTPSVIADGLMLSRAGMTNRLDRLSVSGLVERRHDPDDRRSVKISLTPRGLEVVDAAVADHAANEARILGALDPVDREVLDRVLRVMVANVRHAG